MVEDAAVERAAVEPSRPAFVPARLDGGITVEGLSFQYWNRDRQALDDIDLELPAGAVVALVGENGAGKSTFVKTLCGLYRPSAGRILVDGTDITQFAPLDWRARITAAFQDPVHIELSLQDTVGLGWLEHRDDPERIVEALRAAGGGQLLASLPEGLETGSVGDLGTATDCRAASGRRSPTPGRRCGKRRCCGFWTSPPPASTRGPRNGCSTGTPT